MTLKIISTEDTVFSGEVDMVVLPGEAGEFTVLRNHASLISTLVAGNVRYGSENDLKSIAVNGGVVDVDNNVVSVCVY
ncbi:MAG: ATP synthase F1 subunit epsilon [Clostridium sp.]|nr:ATP synthase F1 subunit epsilon [Clostridium sp.]